MLSALGLLPSASPQGNCTVRPGAGDVSRMTGKAPSRGVTHPPVALAMDPARWYSSAVGVASVTVWPKLLASSTVGCWETGMGGSSGSTARKVPPAGAPTAPPAPYTGTLRSGTSSTYWYSSTQPLVLETVALAAPGSKASV